MTDTSQLLSVLDRTILLLADHNKTQEAAWLGSQRDEIQRGGAGELAAIHQVHKLTTNMGGLADLALYTEGGEYDFASRKQLDQLADELHRLTPQPER